MHPSLQSIDRIQGNHLTLSTPYNLKRNTHLCSLFLLDYGFREPDGLVIPFPIVRVIKAFRLCRVLEAAKPALRNGFSGFPFGCFPALNTLHPECILSHSPSPPWNLSKIFLIPFPTLCKACQSAQSVRAAVTKGMMYSLILQSRPIFRALGFY